VCGRKRPGCGRWLRGAGGRGVAAPCCGTMARLDPLGTRLKHRGRTLAVPEVIPLQQWVWWPCGSGPPAQRVFRAWHARREAHRSSLVLLMAADPFGVPQYAAPSAREGSRTGGVAYTVYRADRDRKDVMNELCMTYIKRPSRMQDATGRKGPRLEKSTACAQAARRGSRRGQDGAGQQSSATLRSGYGWLSQATVRFAPSNRRCCRRAYRIRSSGATRSAIASAAGAAMAC
jgi:hypothetical protein